MWGKRGGEGVGEEGHGEEGGEVECDRAGRREPGGGGHVSRKVLAAKKYMSERTSRNARGKEEERWRGAGPGEWSRGGGGEDDRERPMGKGRGGERWGRYDSGRDRG